MDSISFCLVTTFYPPHGFGGDAVHVQRLAAGLAARGHRVRVVHSAQAYRLLVRGEAPLDGLTSTDGVETVACPGSRSAVVGTYLTGEPLTYRRELARLVDGFDVVHFVNPSLVGGPGAFGMGDGLKLYTATEHWLLCPTHVLFRNQREVCTHKTCWRCTLVYHRPPQVWRSTGRLGRAMSHIDLLFAPSRFTADLHRSAFDGLRVEVLPLLGPDPARLADVPDPPARERPYFVSVGRAEPIKGLDTLVRAFRGVRGADLLIAGDGSQLGRLRELARDVPAVHLLGRVPNRDVLSLCRGARALVVPSVGYETFGIVAVEAMAMGTPAVVRDLGPLPELVEDGGGLTFGGDDDLAATLQRLVDHPDEARTLGDRGRHVYIKRFSEPVIFDTYFEAIARLAEQRGRPELARRAAAEAAWR